MRARGKRDGKRLGGGRLPEGMEGIARFHDLVGRHVEEPGEVVIGIETDRGLFVPRWSRRAIGVRGEPAVHVAFPGPPLRKRREVRSRRRQGIS